MNKLERVRAGQLRIESVDLDFRIQVPQAIGCGLCLWTSDVAGAKQNLALQIGRIDHVEIHQADSAHAGRGQVESQRRAQSARADAQHFRLLDLELTFHAHLGHDQVAAVAHHFLF